MNFLQKYSICFIYFLYFNLTYGNSIFESVKDFTPAVNITLSDIKNLEFKTSCQSINDCSDGAIECKQITIENEKEEKLYCTYPEYVCTNDTCYLLNKDFDKSKFNYSFNNTNIDATSEINKCTKDEECFTNKCSDGYCQINLDSPNVLCTLNNNSTKYQCDKLTGENKINIKQEVKEEKKKENTSSSKITIYVVIGIGIVVGSVLFAIIVRVCYESAEYMEENPEIQEFRKENSKGGAAAAGIAVIGSLF